MKIKCKKCGDIIESKSRHDMVWCKCGKVAIDGGNEYVKISGFLEDIAFVDENNNEFPKAVQHTIKNSRYGKNGSLTAKILCVDAEGTDDEKD